MEILADFKVWANQTTLDEDEVLNGDIYGQISPYVTANYWVRSGFSVTFEIYQTLTSQSCSGGQVSCCALPLTDTQACDCRCEEVPLENLWCCAYDHSWGRISSNFDICEL